MRIRCVPLFMAMNKNKTNISVRHWLLSILILIVEAFIWMSGFYAVSLMQATKPSTNYPFIWLILFGWGLLFLVITTRFISNNAFSRTARRDEVVACAMKTALACSVLAFAAFTERDSMQIAGCILFFLTLTIERLILNSWFIRYALRHNEHGVIICNEDTLWQQKVLQQNTYGLKLTRLEELSAPQLEVYLEAHPEAESVYCAPTALSGKELEDVAHTCRKQDIALYLLPQPVFALNKTMLSECRGNVSVLSAAQPPLQCFFNRTVKRLTDIVLSLIVLLTVFPVVALVAYICIKRQSRGPVLMMRHMCGMDGKTFQCLTFRTRHYEAAPSFLVGIDDPGYFPFGKFLTVSRLEQLPQFLCVLWGNMTIVGSQMMRPELYPEYRRELRQFFIPDCHLKAGITSYYPTSQSQGSTKTDVWYYRNWGFWLDMRIMLQRLGILLKKSKAKSINYI